MFFSSDQAHSSVERAGLLGGVRLRQLPADDNNKLRGETLRAAIQEDRDNGLIPFYVSYLSILIFNIERKKFNVTKNILLMK